MITVPRFSKKELNKIPTEMVLHSDSTILIHDHLNDNVIAFIQLDSIKKDNEHLADKIIEVIEEFIEDGSSEN